MLELTTACVEPAAHLFLRRVAPPLRSARLLGPHFWHNGAHAIDVPPWWPSYLDSIRQIPQAHNNNTQLDKAHEKRVSDRPRKQPRPTPKRLIPVGARNNIHHRHTRAFSRSLHNSEPSQGVQLQEDGESSNSVRQYPSHPQYQEPSDWQAGQDRRWLAFDELERTSQYQRLGQALPTSESYSTSLPSNPSPDEPPDPDVQHLQSLLAPGLPPSLARRRRDKLWDLWNTLPDQERFASQVLANLAASRDTIHLVRALQAFSIIPSEDRSSLDYQHAIAAAIARHRYAQAFQICDESVQHGFQFKPAQTLLLCCLRQRLWKNAARTWQSYFQGHDHRQADWSAFDNDPDLVTITSRLLSRLNAPDLVLVTDRPLLKALSVVLVNRLTNSQHIMSLITQQGILQLFGHCRDLNIIRPQHYIQALSTLCRAAKARMRVDLALVIFRSFKLDAQFIGHGTFIGLLHLCAEADSNPEVFRHLMKEYQQAHVPELSAYNIVMMAMARQANVREVESYFQEFRATAHVLDLSILLPRIYVHAISGDTIAAKSAFDEIGPIYGMQPNIQCWNTLLYAHSRSNDPRKVFTIFDQMTAQHIEPTPHTFGILTGVASNLGDTNQTLSLLDRANKARVPPTGELLASAVHSFCLNHKPEEAWAFAEQATRAGVHGSPVRMWNTLLRHYAFLTDTAALRKIRGRMRELQVKPDEMTHAAVMTALVRMSKTSEALRLARSLHFSGAHSATAFHFSILIHGFAMEGNRDMALTIYKEMEQRFSRISPSARLAMLYAQIQRDISSTAQRSLQSRSKEDLTLPHAESTVNDILLHTSVADQVSKDPQPGFRRRKLLATLPSISAEALIDALMADVQSSKAQNVVQSLQATPVMSLAAHLSNPQDINLLTRQMFILLHEQSWEAVDSIFNTILAIAIARSVPSNSRPDFFSELQSFQSSGSDDVAAAERYKSLLERHSLQILPANRFTLSRPLSRYMQALQQQPNITSRIKSLVKNLQSSGFELSSKNWNSYVQALCKSASFEDHLAAFEMFSDKFQSAAPPYRVLFSSRWTNPKRIVKGRRADVAPRSVTEHMNPGKLIPTYFTVVHLASTIGKHRRDFVNFESRVKALAPATYDYICKLPYKADRVQGVLLRGATPYSNLLKRIREEPVMEPGGVVGSRAPLDQISEDVLEISHPQVSERDVAQQSVKQKLASDLQVTATVEGETMFSPKRLPGQGRNESAEELNQRLDGERNKSLNLAHQIRQDMSLERLVADDYIGDPAYLLKPNSTFTLPKVSQKPRLSILAEDRARQRRVARLGMMPEATDNTESPEKALSSALHALSGAKRLDRINPSPSVRKPQQIVDNVTPLSGMSQHQPLKSSPKLEHSLALHDHAERKEFDHQAPGVSLLNPFLGPRDPGRNQGTKSAFAFASLESGRVQSLSRTENRREVAERRTTQRAVRQLLRLLPRSRDLDFRARTARKAGELERAQIFQNWADSPVFRWSKIIKTVAQRRTIYDRLTKYAPSLGESDEFELKSILKLMSNPKGTMYEAMMTSPAMKSSNLEKDMIQAQNIANAPSRQQSQPRVIRDPSIATTRGMPQTYNESQLKPLLPSKIDDSLMLDRSEVQTKLLQKDPSKNPIWEPFGAFTIPDLPDLDSTDEINSKKTALETHKHVNATKNVTKPLDSFWGSSVGDQFTIPSTPDDQWLQAPSDPTPPAVPLREISSRGSEQISSAEAAKQQQIYTAHGKAKKEIMSLADAFGYSFNRQQKVDRFTTSLLDQHTPTTGQDNEEDAAIARVIRKVDTDVEEEKQLFTVLFGMHGDKAEDDTSLDGAGLVAALKEKAIWIEGKGWRRRREGK